MQNWIAKNANDYVDKAEYYSNKKFLNELKRRLIIDSKKSILLIHKLLPMNLEK